MTFSRRSLLVSPLVAAPALMADRNDSLLYIGAYTSAKNKGITVARFDKATGAISEMSTAAETPNPTFLELHSNGKWLYAINEVSNFGGKKEGSVDAYSIDKASGKLTLLNQVSSKGAGPCHVSLDRGGRMVMIANYGSGSVASYKIEADGKLSEAVSFFQHEGKGPVAGRQAGPHAHSVNVTPDNRYAVACDLGTDEIRIYKLDPGKGSMEKHKVVNTAPGSGPRHFAWHPKKMFGYVVNELNSTVTVFLYAPDGNLEEIQSVSTLPEGYRNENSPAEVRVHPSGKFLYASNRGEDTIAVFVIDPATGKLSPVDRTLTQGGTPRNFYIESTGRWLLAANQKTDNIIVFAIDQKTGKLQNTGKGIIVGQPVCLRILG
ncbi:lactonase family protein [uncultured Paludibaculum sp.]|uniref:lactonase family protein n=1 Tax=uncultured Paludibaculum sp. TaxID=1765020 RepID=UPI002AABCF47|nr:lactonase family protein [uncultured Paludibaculum sp.]